MRRSGLRWQTGLALREVLDAIQAEELKEALGGAVEDRASGDFGSAVDADEVLFHQAADGLPAGDAADRFDVGSQDRLLVGDDRQRFEGGFGELGVDVFLMQALEDVAEV